MFRDCVPLRTAVILVSTIALLSAHACIINTDVLGVLIEQLTKQELEKEKILHSLTPQLERWRARVTAVAKILAEERFRMEGSGVPREVGARERATKYTGTTT